MKTAVIAAGALCLAGCYSTADGPDPTTPLYFPVGLAVSPGGDALYVANSDFDLQFNAGTVEVYRLNDIRRFFQPIWSVDSSTAAAANECVTLGLGVNLNPLLYPGPCGALDLQSPPAPYFTPPTTALPIANSARIGAFATDILFACQPTGGDPGATPPVPPGTSDCSSGPADPRGARLFVPVRGDPSLTFFEVDDDRGGAPQSFRLDCNQNSNDGRCADSNRIGVDPNESSRGLTMPPEPFGLAISDRADSISVTHQIAGGAVSLVTGSSAVGMSVMVGKPTLEHVVGGLPAPATGIAALPIPAVVSVIGVETNYQEGFVVDYRGAAVADIFRFFDDKFAAPQRPFLSFTTRSTLTATPGGIDQRGVAIDRSSRAPRMVCEQQTCPAQTTACNASCTSMPADAQTACQKACSDAFNQCLSACTRIPLSIFIASRIPASLLVGEVNTLNPTGSSDTLSFFDSVPLSAGPSRVVVGKIQNQQGQTETRVFVICFDARIIFVYDPLKRRVDGEIPTGRGPHALAMDPTEAIAYVGHFTDSYIGVIDLNQAHVGSYGSVVATIGAPLPPQDSK